MVKNNKICFFIYIFVLSLIFILLNLVNFSAEDCWTYSETNSSACINSGFDCVWRTQAEDSWCLNSAGCCKDKGCWLYAGTNESACIEDYYNYGTSCMWDMWMNNYFPNNTLAPSGGCVMNWTSNNVSWGGVSSTGCWNYDGNKATCAAQGGGTCKWSANNQNQDPWCYIKTLVDAQNKNPSATTDDIGCCQNIGCWNYDNNETACKVALQGSCSYTNNSVGGGWCNTKTCSEIIGEENCTYVKQSLMMPCNWTGTACSGEIYGTGGFGFYNDSDSCFSAGGWYNSTGDCVMPTGDFVGGGGGFMFAGDVHCWFADNQPRVCGNITGCAYCVTGDGDYGITNASAENICYNKQIGFCEGHDKGDVNTSYINANNSANLACADIQLKTACNYGPLPNCKWNSSANITGPYCEAGASSEKKSAPPAQYCEDPIAKNNYTVCIQLANDFMMPCIWQNTTYPIQNCTFNSNAVFGGSGGETDFGIINSQFSCTSAGGTWTTEYYVDDVILKQDSWCEMTGFFNIDQGNGQGNKGNCDTSCWACEFQNNGTAWANVAAAEAACEASVAVGGQPSGCAWINDTTGTKAFNKLGWCDYPKEMESGGSKDCNIECEGCNFMGDPQTACEGSMANNGTGCKWVNDTNNLIKGGYCVDKTKKTCSSDCFSCYDTTSCINSALNCTWDPTFSLCKTNGFAGEICFNGVDDDSDILIDCADPDCGFDNFCGGSSFGGDCFAKTTKQTCNNTIAFGGLNCTWINDTWNADGWCDMPGANCWKFGDNLTACGQTAGCTNESSSMGTNAWCEMNMTQMDASSCWSYSDETTCAEAAGNCQWKNNSWQGATGGWCDYAPMSVCMDLNSTTCSANSNCTWQSDNYSMTGGWCNVACMNTNWNQTNCENATLAGLCQWKNMSATCQPTTFMMMGTSGGGGGMSGCPQYNGNETGCLTKNITCTYKNDSYANNNLSATESEGWCMDKSEFEHFGDMEGNIIHLAMDDGNINGAAESGVDGSVDMLGMGIRINNEGFNFGAGIFNISDSIICNGQMVGGGMGQGMPTQGTGNKTGKFYWYLDTDGNSSDGCVAVPVSGANLTGFDFMINYISRNTSTGIVETKQLMRCASGIWNPTNALVTTSKKLSCGEISGVMIAVSKQDIESFAEYNKTANMRIFIVSAGEDGSRTTPEDSVGPGYYTPGTVDFGFIDCSNPANAKDPKCKNFQKFGFNVFEECKNGVDDDENGLVDCDDPFCVFIPDCAGANAFNFTTNTNDKTAPVVMFSEVEKLADAAFVRVDTNEPSNLNLSFYLNDSSCTTANITLIDAGTGYQANANFKPFHSVDLIQDTLGYVLVNNTVYYYKITVCDSSNNCAVSACSNFTTKTTAVDKSFIFKMELPDGYTVDIPAFNKTGYNFSESFGGVNYEVGIKTNTSVTKNINFTIHCSDMSIGFFGVNILDPTKIDLSNAFVCNTTKDIIGMNSTLKKWNKLINDLHLGGAMDYIEITIPVAYSTSNTFNWTDDSGNKGQDVDAYVSCSGNSTRTVCKVPVSMGFSAYTLSVPAASPPASGTPGGGGDDGGEAAGAGIYIATDTALISGYTKELAKNDKIKFTIQNETHYVTLESFSSTTATINVSSIPQIAILIIGAEKKFELTNDNIYDISVKLNSINMTSNKTSLTIKKVGEKITASITGEIVGEEEETGQEGLGGGEEKTGFKFGTKTWILIGVVSTLIILVIFFIFRRRKNSKH